MGILQPVQAGRSTFQPGRQKKSHRAVGVPHVPLFKAGEPLMLQAACPQREAPTPSHAACQGRQVHFRTRQSRQGPRIHCIAQRDSAHANPLHVMTPIYQA